MALPPKRQRSQRLRKKMRVDEFQEMGFEYQLTLKDGVSEAQEEALMDRFVLELLAPRNLAGAGWVSEGFISPWVRGSATEDDRTATQAWLAAQPEVASADVGPLQDAWYAED